MSSITHSPPFRYGAYAGRRDIMEWVADAVLILATCYALQLFSPIMDPVEFVDLEVRDWAAETSEGNLFNQLMWIGLAALATIAVVRAPSRLTRIVAPLWPLVALVALCVVSTVWSDYPDAAFRRSAQAGLVFYCFLVGVVYSSSIQRVVLSCYLIFWTLLLFNLAIVPAPWAFDLAGAFRGIFGHKNGVGAVAALALLFGLAIIRQQNGRVAKLLCCFYILAWGVLLLLSHSKTSMALSVIAPISFLILNTASRFFRINVGALLIFGIGMAALAIGLLSYGAGYKAASIVGSLTGDASFTGRDVIWEFMLEHISGRWLLGHGFGSFWGVGFESPNMQSVVFFIRLLNQGHNGYLDLLVSLGVVGLVLFLVQILKTGVQSEVARYKSPAFFQLIWTVLIFSLIHNVTESSLLRGFSPVWVFTLIPLLIGARLSVEVRHG